MERLLLATQRLPPLHGPWHEQQNEKFIRFFLFFLSFLSFGRAAATDYGQRTQAHTII